MRVLITNNTLSVRAGSELYVRDVALALKQRGHQPLTYSPRLGQIAEELRAAEIPVYDNLNQLDCEPDIIHGQHHLETLTALHLFPKTPALYYCHGAKPWEEAPLVHPRILRYVAVDRPCHERLVTEDNIDPSRIVTLFNFVDLERFQPRSPLPPKPRRALVFSNYANENTHLKAIRSACEQTNLSLDVIGIGSGNISLNPENELGKYDIVFAKARSAIEALAVGNAVILCDYSGAGPMVTTQNLEHLRPLNFGFSTMVHPLAAEPLIQEINRYDATDAQLVSERMRATASLDSAMDHLFALYHEIIADASHSPSFVIGVSDRATADYLKWLSQRLNEYYAFAYNCDVLRSTVNQLEADQFHLQAQLNAAKAASDELETQKLKQQAQIQILTDELAAQRNLPQETLFSLFIKELKQKRTQLSQRYPKYRQ